MKTIIIIAITIGTFAALVNSEIFSSGDCGKRPLKPKDDGNRIVGGVEALEGDWPWACVMYYNNRFSCGGSLIAEKWIVSAAHCVSTTTASAFKWQCGVHNRVKPESSARNFTVSKVYRHENYISRTIENDIALFELNESAAPYNDRLLPACVTKGEDNADGNIVWAVGWGTLTSGALPNVLQEISFPITSNATCTEYYGTSYKPANQICAGIKGDGKDTCQGDSGGPLMRKSTDGLWRIMGLTSWGRGCGDIGVYSRVSALRDWMISKMGDII